MAQRDKRITPLPLTTATALIGGPTPDVKGGPLQHPALVTLPPCSIAARNMSVHVGVALAELPSPAQRQDLSASLCKAIEAAGDEPPMPVTFVEDQREARDGLAMAMIGGYAVPTSLHAAVVEKRAAFWELASTVLQRSARRFEHEHPGVHLRLMQGAGTQLVRFYVDAPFGGIDVLTELNAPAGGKLPTDVDVKNYFYEDWCKAGLPAQTNLQVLLHR